MSIARNLESWRRRAGGIAAAAWLAWATPAVAQDEVPPPAETPTEVAEPAAESEEKGPGDDISVTLGGDLASAYYFRGIPQENQGVIFQPYAEIGLNLLETDAISWGVAVGTWNSFHYDAPGGPGNPWYESDIYVATSLGLPGGLEFGIGYTYLYGPNAGGVFAEEIAFSLGFDESTVVDLPFSLGPSVTLVQELEGGSDGLGAGGDRGTYLEIGLEPGFEIPVGGEDSGFAVGISVPLVVGLDLDDYYETSTGSDGDVFGFFQASLAVSVPLTFVPERLGSWSVSGAGHMLVLGDGAQDIGDVDFGVTGGDEIEFYVSGGITIEH